MRKRNGTLLVIIRVLGGGVLCASLCAYAKEYTVGLTYKIQEKDALDEMQARASKVNWQEVVNLPQEEWGGLKSLELPRAMRNNTREHVPFYSLEFDITDAQGEVIYPSGYTFNPLDFSRLPGRIVVIGRADKDLEWLAKNRKAGDMILTAGGNPYEVSTKISDAVFLLDEQTRSRLSLDVVPSIVEQIEKKLVIQEFYVKAN